MIVYKILLKIFQFYIKKKFINHSKIEVNLSFIISFTTMADKFTLK